MKKSILALSSVAVLFSSMAFAHPQHGKPHHNPEFHKAIGECFAEAGVAKPTMSAPTADKPSADNQTAQKPRGEHPKFTLTDAQKTQVDACLAKKGIEKPAMPEHRPDFKPEHKFPAPAQKAS